MVNGAGREKRRGSHGLELVDALLRVALANVLQRLELVDAAPLVLLVETVVAHQLRRVHCTLQVARDLLQRIRNMTCTYNITTTTTTKSIFSTVSSKEVHSMLHSCRISTHMSRGNSKMHILIIHRFFTYFSLVSLPYAFYLSDNNMYN